jgi:hypothetical protein
MPSPSCQTNILLKERLEDIITRAKKKHLHGLKHFQLELQICKSCGLKIED